MTAKPTQLKPDSLKPKKRRSRSPKKPPPDKIPSAGDLAFLLLSRPEASQSGILSEHVHVKDIGKPLGAVLLRRLTTPETGQ